MNKEYKKEFYEIGDKVVVKDNLIAGETYGMCFTESMNDFIHSDAYKGYVTIKRVTIQGYVVEEFQNIWTREMFEGLYKEEVTRKSCLEKAMKIVTEDRDKQYGKPEDSFPVIANLWSAYLGVDITPTDAAMLLGLLKVARIKTGKYKEDNYIDLAGYTACACEIGGKENESTE